MMMMMKKPIILVTCILLFSFLAVLASETGSQPSQCCFEFISTKLSKKRVVNYQYTDDRCSKKAVLFTMNKGGVICAAPSVEWVKKIIQYKEEIRTKTINSSGSK